MMSRYFIVACISVSFNFRNRLSFPFDSILFCGLFLLFDRCQWFVCENSYEYYYYSFIYQRRSIDSHISAQYNLVICFRMPSTKTKIKYTQSSLHAMVSLQILLANKNLFIYNRPEEHEGKFKSKQRACMVNAKLEACERLTLDSVRVNGAYRCFGVLRRQ